MVLNEANAIVSKIRHHVDIKSLKSTIQFLNHICWFAPKIQHLLKDYIFYKKIAQANVFVQNRNAHTGSLLKNPKILKFSDKVALESCILISQSLHKPLPKILCDRLTLSFESHAHSTRWAKNGCINIPFYRTKYNTMVDIMLLKCNIYLDVFAK